MCDVAFSAVYKRAALPETFWEKSFAFPQAPRRRSCYRAREFPATVTLVAIERASRSSRARACVINRRLRRRAIRALLEIKILFL